MNLPPLTAGFVGFGEVNSPRDWIDRKCLAARQALESRGVHLVATAPVNDDTDGSNEARAREELSHKDFDVLVVCLAGWIPSHSVIDVIMPFAHKPMVLWGLTGEYINGRLVTTADQAGTTAVRDALDALGLHVKYVYDTPDAPYAAAEKVVHFCEVARAAALLKRSRVGMMGYRDMKLSSTLVDFISLRRVVGPEVEVFETLEMTQAMAASLPDCRTCQRVAVRQATNPRGPFSWHPSVLGDHAEGQRTQLPGHLADRRGRRQEAAAFPTGDGARSFGRQRRRGFHSRERWPWRGHPAHPTLSHWPGCGLL